MDLKSFGKLAAVSALALAAAMHVSGVNAAAYINGDPLEIGVEATVDNTFDVAVTDMAIGTIAALNSDAGDIATLVIDSTDTLDVDDPGLGIGTADQASIVMDPTGDPEPALIEVTNAFDDVTLYVTYSNCTMLTLGGAGTGPEFTITEIEDNSTTDLSWDCDDTTPMPVANTYPLVGGAVDISVGLTMVTDGSTNVAYPDGLYQGSFDIHIAY